jgi:nucleotide-binding universal stress UspA family protein
MPEVQTRPMRVILAIDDSKQSEQAVRAVSERPWPAGTQVRVMTVLESGMPSPPPSMAAVMMEGGSAMAVRQKEQNAAEHLARRAAESLTNVQAEFVVRDGDPGSVIVREAAQWPADLIVMGSSGRGGLKRLVLGSVSQAVAAKAPCSVELVRVNERGPAGMIASRFRKVEAVTAE